MANHQNGRRVIRTLVFSLFLAVIVMLQLPQSAFAYQTRSNNFKKTYTLTGKGANDIVAVANEQVGKTKGQLGYTEAWCADFVMDCARLSGISTDVINYSNKSNAGWGNFYRNLTGSCGAVVVDAGSRKKGDLVFYYRPDTGKYPHVGIYDGSGYFIEGNLGGKVTRYNGTYYADSQKKIGTNNGKVKRIYVRPQYTNTEPTPVPTVSFSDTATGKQAVIKGASGTTLYYSGY